MQKLSIPVFTNVTKTYCSLAKPRIILGNVITAAGGFALASKGYFNFPLFLVTLLGLSLVVASACVFNNYIDRESDKKMVRTQYRVLAQGLIPLRKAMIFALFLVAFGTLLLSFTNLLTVACALLGFLVYVTLYTFSKYHSIHATLIGSIAGAMPPVVGYCAVSNCLDTAAFIFFIMMILWQMPHFYAIAIYRLDDYAQASIPVLPIKKGMFATKVQMLLYAFAFLVSSLMLTVFHYTGFAYLIVATLLGLYWLWLCITGFKCANDQLWARKVFIFSLVVVTGICLVIPFSIV